MCIHIITITYITLFSSKLRFLNDISSLIFLVIKTKIISELGTLLKSNQL